MASPIDRTHPPISSLQQPVAFPPIRRGRLSNGVDVHLIESHVQPIVSVRLVIRGGSSVDGRRAGLAHFVATTLQSGAAGRDTHRIAEEFEVLGAEFDAAAGRDETTVRVVVLRRHLERALEVMADVALAPDFPEEEVLRERRRSVADIRQNRSDAAYLASTQIRRELYRATPYAAPIEGTPESLRKIDRQACVEFHRSQFTPDGSFFVIAGDVTIDEATAILDRHFGAWTGPARTPPPPFVGTPPTSRHVILVDRPDALQSTFTIGRRAITRADADFIPLVTLHTLFGGYFNSRLNRNLREVHGFTYGAGSSVEALALGGIVTCGASVGTAVTVAAIEETLAELHRLIVEAVGNEELAMVRRYVSGSQALQLETPENVARFVRSIVLHGLPEDAFARFPLAVSAVTAEELLAVARRWMDPAQMCVVVVGDASRVARDLEAIGPVHTVDARGKAIAVGSRTEGGI